MHQPNMVVGPRGTAIQTTIRIGASARTAWRHSMYTTLYHTCVAHHLFGVAPSLLALCTSSALRSPHAILTKRIRICWSLRGTTVHDIHSCDAHLLVHDNHQAVRRAARVSQHVVAPAHTDRVPLVTTACQSVIALIGSAGGGPQLCDRAELCAHVVHVKYHCSCVARTLSGDHAHKSGYVGSFHANEHCRVRTRA